MEIDRSITAEILLPDGPLAEDDRAEILRRLGPEPDWSSLGTWRGGGSSADFFVPSSPDERFALRCYRAADGGTVAKVWFGRGSQGPPGFVHGGAQAAVVDHVLGAAAWEAGLPSFTASLTYNFRRSVPLGTIARIDAWLERIEGRKVYVAARLCGADGTLFGEANALFLQMGGDALVRFAQGAE